jgi:hypothetical protein
MRSRMIFLVLLPVLLGAKCGESIIKDPGFELWCGETLCNWRIEEGSITRAPTWHERDHGVDLVGPAVHLSQRADFGDDRPSCLSYDLLSDVGDKAQVVLEMDFDEDGAVELTQVLPLGPWTRLSYKTPAPSWYRSIKFSIRKRGEGPARLARIRVGADIDCQGPAPSTSNRPTGAPCETPAQCTSATCEGDGDAGSSASAGRRCR